MISLLPHSVAIMIDDPSFVLFSLMMLKVECINILILNLDMGIHVCVSGDSTILWKFDFTKSPGAIGGDDSQG